MEKRHIILLSVLAGVILIAAMALSFYKSKIIKQEAINDKVIEYPPIEVLQERAMPVEDLNDPSQIKYSFDRYAGSEIQESSKYVEDGISFDYSPSGRDGKKVDLDLFLQAIGARINPKIRELVGSNYYGFFYCINEKKEKEYGLALDIGDEDPDKLKSYNSEAKESMRQWEPYILKDLHNILFPSNDLEKRYLDKSPVFKDGKFRYAEIELPDGQSSINYAIKDQTINRIYVTTSQECLKKSLDYLFDD